MDAILANVLSVIGLKAATAAGHQVLGTTEADSPVAAAIVKVGIQTVDAEVIPALEAWSESTEFEQCLTALTTGEKDFTAETLVDSFIEAGDLYAGTGTEELALKTLRAFGKALEEALLAA